jgi:hypothetical protein
MANEIHIDFESGNTLYVVVRNNEGNVWCVAGQTFETWGTGEHNADDYDIGLTDKSGDRYIGDFDSNIDAGRYTVQAFLQAGANPDDSDDVIGSGEIVWTGAGELTSDKILANKAIQTKSTGTINYYDDDGQTVILTHTPDDAESSITRIPS